jgi:hypothetical protein
MEQFNTMRHGHKLRPGEVRGPLEQSGLSAEQQQTWREAVDRLGLEADPEITYESLPLIEKIAADLYERLPEKATVIFSSTKYPRARLTADFFSSALIKVAAERKDKDVGVAFLWEPGEDASKDTSTAEVLDVSGEFTKVWELMKEVKDLEYPDDTDLAAYFSSNDGNRRHPKENEVLMKAVNLDLSRDNSVFKKRAERLKVQLQSLDTILKTDSPIYFFGVGHHSNLISLDIALNDRTHYDSVDQIPEPLAIWKADKTKLEEILEEKHA